MLIAPETLIESTGLATRFQIISQYLPNPFIQTFHRAESAAVHGRLVLRLGFQPSASSQDPSQVEFDLGGDRYTTHPWAALLILRTDSTRK